jgi:hypothetical protein
MPLYLSVFSFLTSLISLAYGILGRYPYIMVSVLSGLCLPNWKFYTFICSTKFPYWHICSIPPIDTKRRRVFNRNSSVDCVLHLQRMEGSTQNSRWYGAGKLYRVAQIVRFLVEELIHPDSNSKFDMNVVLTTNYSFSERWCPRRQWGTLGGWLRESHDQVSSVFQKCS